MSLHLLLRHTHLAFGVVALLTFWLAALTRKGRPVHRGAGQAYLLAMAALLVPAVPLAVRIGITHSRVGGVFLGYLEIVVLTSVWLGRRAVRDKRDWARYTGRAYHALAWLNLASGAIVLALGLLVANQMRGILVAFSLVGLLGGLGMLRFARAAPREPDWWLKEHVGAMLGNGVGTHIAFLSLGLPKLLPMLAGPMLQNIAWLGPLGVAVLARVWLGRRYLKPRGGSAPITPAMA
jgi:hypothetical protein